MYKGCDCTEGRYIGRSEVCRDSDRMFPKQESQGCTIQGIDCTESQVHRKIRCIEVLIKYRYRYIGKSGQAGLLLCTYT